MGVTSTLRGGVLRVDAFCADVFRFAVLAGTDRFAGFFVGFAATADFDVAPAAPDFFEAFLAAEARGFLDDACVVFLAFTGALLAEDVGEEASAVFLRVFLDIRLPFVAFSGVSTGLWERRSEPETAFGGWANLTCPGYGDKRISRETNDPLRLPVE
jgi:hypothetical protein